MKSKFSKIRGFFDYRQKEHFKLEMENMWYFKEGTWKTHPTRPKFCIYLYRWIHRYEMRSIFRIRSTFLMDTLYEQKKLFFLFFSRVWMRHTFLISFFILTNDKIFLHLKFYFMRRKKRTWITQKKKIIAAWCMHPAVWLSTNQEVKLIPLLSFPPLPWYKLHKK